ncbi:MAG: FtsQ-type POTRA domain-containing protein [Coriobacteriia bacterium]|nr:FtsQ-type POTRA domain-containing protein [Coriobacteriia bacterium]
MASNYRQKSAYWERKRRDDAAPRRRRDETVPRTRRRVEVSSSTTYDTKSAPVEQQRPARKKSVSPSRSVSQRTSSFEVVPDIPDEIVGTDAVVAKERRKVVLKKEERERRAKRDQNRSILVIVAAGALAVILIGVTTTFLTSPYFHITDYIVNGNAHLTNETVLTYVDTDESTSLVTLDTGAIRREMLANPWVEEVAIHKRYPSTLEIVVTERMPFGLVSETGGSRWLIAEDGIWLGQVLEKDGDLVADDPRSDSVPVSFERDDVIPVNDIPPTTDIIVGMSSVNDEVNNVLAVWHGIDEELRAQTLLFSAPEVALTKIVTKDNVEVFIGSAVDINEKSKVAVQLLSEHAGKVTLINVRSLDRPTWRGLDTSGGAATKP